VIGRKYQLEKHQHEDGAFCVPAIAFLVVKVCVYCQSARRLVRVKQEELLLTLHEENAKEDEVKDEGDKHVP
jgi:hypothetical protein